MGIACKGDKIWLSANNYLYQYDLTPEGKGINKKLIVEDKNKAWNPFGMFVLEWGLDGLLYVSVGNHNINIVSPDGNISGRGSSGIVFRMNPDGTKMERLVHGCEYHIHLIWIHMANLIVSNGEGNPNRFVRVIDGVDYHCYSRPAVDKQLVGRQSPASALLTFEMHRGAHTQLIRYYGGDFSRAIPGQFDYR